MTSEQQQIRRITALVALASEVAEAEGARLAAEADGSADDVEALQIAVDTARGALDLADLLKSRHGGSTPCE
jgi:hypothetical protein